MMGGSIFDRNITVFDFETTGLSAENDRVIELAAARIRNGEVIGTFQTIVHQPVELPQKITEITGITTELMRSGMDEDPAFRILNRLIGDSTIVAHNAGFDLGFLHQGLMRLAGRSFTNPFIDTLTICRDRYTYPHKLTDMCSRLDIELTGAHRALNDVIGCWEVLKRLHEEQPVDGYINLLGFLKKYGPPKWVPDYANVVGQDNRYAS